MATCISWVDSNFNFIRKHNLYSLPSLPSTEWFKSHAIPHEAFSNLSQGDEIW